MHACVFSSAAVVRLRLSPTSFYVSFSIIPTLILPLGSPKKAGGRDVSATPIRPSVFFLLHVSVPFFLRPDHPSATLPKALALLCFSSVLLLAGGTSPLRVRKRPAGFSVPQLSSSSQACSEIILIPRGVSACFRLGLGSHSVALSPVLSGSDRLFPVPPGADDHPVPVRSAPEAPLPRTVRFTVLPTLPSRCFFPLSLAHALLTPYSAAKP